MAIPVKCKHCGFKGQAAEHHLGLTLECPKCGGLVEVNVLKIEPDESVKLQQAQKVEKIKVAQKIEDIKQGEVKPFWEGIWSLLA